MTATERRNPFLISAVLVLLLFSFCFSQVTSQLQFHSKLGTQFYNSYSQLTLQVPMKIGYPAFRALSIFIEIGASFSLLKADNSISFFFTSSGLSSDDGLEKNLVLTDQSSLLQTSLTDHLLWQLFDWKGFRGSAGGASELQFHYRKLVYPSSMKERTIDFDLGLGPDLMLQYQKQQMEIGTSVTSLFYLPYFNYGNLKKQSGNQIISYSSYYAFYYRTLIDFHLGYSISRNKKVTLGITQDNIVGFADRKRKFFNEDLIHYRLDRTYRLYLGYSL